MVLCKPKLLPLKSFTLQKLEKMQREASEKAKDQLRDEAQALEQAQNSTPTHAPETMTFD